MAHAIPSDAAAHAGRVGRERQAGMTRRSRIHRVLAQAGAWHAARAQRATRLGAAGHPADFYLRLLRAPVSFLISSCQKEGPRCSHALREVEKRRQ